MQWLLGDWWNAGVQWGEGEAVCEALGIDYGVARNCGSIAATFELSRRRDKLSFRHHTEVCALDYPAVQDRFLDWGLEPFDTTGAVAINWIIANQLGRRNLTEEQKSYLRGKRYNLEKKPQGGDHKSTNQNDVLMHNKLAEEYKVSPSTIQRDGDFSTAVDALESQVRQDIRDTVLRRQGPTKERPTKEQVISSGRLVHDKTVTPQPFMRREGWKPYQVLEAIERLGAMPGDEHAAINALGWGKRCESGPILHHISDRGIDPLTAPPGHGPGGAAPCHH